RRCVGRARSGADPAPRPRYFLLRPGRSVGSLATELDQSPLQQAPLSVVMDEPERAFVRRAGLGAPAEASQQLPAGGVEVVEVLQRQRVEDLKSRFGALRLGDRNRSVE